MFCNSSCTSYSSSTSGLKREWMLVSLPNFSKKELIKANAKIVFEEDKKGNLNHGIATFGCSSTQFSFKIKNKGIIKVHPNTLNIKPCEETKLQNQFNLNLKNINRYKIDGHFLYLYDQKGNEIKAIAADWD